MIPPSYFIPGMNQIFTDDSNRSRRKDSQSNVFSFMTRTPESKWDGIRGIQAHIASHTCMYPREQIIKYPNFAVPHSCRKQKNQPSKVLYIYSYHNDSGTCCIHMYIHLYKSLVYLQRFSSISSALLNLPTRSLFSTLRLVLWHLWHPSALTLKLKDTIPKLTCLLTVDHWDSMQPEKTFVLEGRGGSVRYRC